MLLASHNLYQVEKLCQKAIWLNRGRVEAAGRAADVTRAYREFVEARETDSAASGTSPVMPNGRLRLVCEISFAGPVAVQVDLSGLAGASFGIEVRRHTGQLIARLSIPASGALEIAAETLLPGSYSLHLRDAEGALHSTSDVRILGERRELGTVLLSHSWGPS